MRYCSGAEPGDETEADHRVGVSYSLSSTKIDFQLDGGPPDEATADFDKHAVTASIERRFFERLTLQLSGGAVLDGTLELLDTTHDLEPGWLASLAASYRVLDPDGFVPFVIAGASFGMSRVTTREEGVAGAESVGLTALDGRLSAIVGEVLVRGGFSAYAGLRVFGLPVSWTFRGQDATGSDHYHFQVPIGVFVGPFGGFDAFVEVSPVGERALVIGAGFGF